MAEEIQRRILSVQDGVDDSRRIPVNASQSLYSGIVPPPPGDMTVLSSAIWHGTVYAGTALSAEIGDLSSFLCRELGWTPEQLVRRLAPAQIDATVMIIHGLMNNDRRAHDFLLADEAGFGKGRVLMTVALWCCRNGILPVVLTKTTALFSNLWQDAIDIGAEDIFRRPFLINEHTQIVGLNGQGTIFGNISPKLHRSTIRDKKDLPDEFGLVMLTWSQLAAKTNAKLDWILHLGGTRRIMAIGDECHTAVSRSALIAQSAAKIRNVAIGSCDTSATSARHVMNMASYRNIYPWLADLPLHTMETMPHRHRAWLAEMSVQAAIRNGKMIRREIDRSGVVIDVIEPSQDVISDNKALSDYFGQTLSEMRELWKLVKAYVDSRNTAAEMQAESIGKTVPKSAKMSVAGNFYARMDTICLQFDACVSADMAISLACQQLLEGIQPTIILNMTMESAAKQILGIDSIVSDEGDAAPSSDEDAEDGPIDIDLANRPLTFPDILMLMLDNIVSIVVSKQKSRLDLNAVGMEPMLMRYERVASMIQNMPVEMPASPIDYIREGIIARGKALFAEKKIPWEWNVGEISGRTAYLKDGRYVRREEDMNETIIGYNSGFLDCIIMTAAGSTGGSMHHTAGPTPESNKRRRPHSQIEVVGSRDPIERIQTRGRIARRGVISTPRYAILISGTPYSRCRLAIETAKEKMLNAAVSGVHRAGVENDAINMLSPAGDGVARDILISNPDLAEYLGIDLIYADPNDETWHVRRLMGRSMLLPCDEAEKMMSRFLNGMKRESRHVRNIAVSQIGNGWEMSETMTLLEAGDKHSHPQSIWFQDTGVATLTRKVPITGRTQMDLPPLAAEVPDLPILKKRAETALLPYLESVKPLWAKSVKHALSVANKPGLFPNIKRNACVLERERYNRFMALMPHLKVGEAFILPDAMGEQRPAILTNISIPSNPLAWRRYSLDYIVPGDKTVYVTDLIPFLETESIYIADNAKARSRFPMTPEGERTETLFVLQGNIHRAILHASRADVGRKVEFGNTSGGFFSGIVLTRRERQAIMAAPLLVPSVDCAKSLLAAGADLFCANSLTIRGTSSGIVIQVDTKGRNGRLDVILAGICGCKANSASFPVPLNEVGRALEAVSFFYSIACASRHRPVMAQIMDGVNLPQIRAEQPNQRMEAPAPAPAVRNTHPTRTPASRIRVPARGAVASPAPTPQASSPQAKPTHARAVPERRAITSIGSVKASAPVQPAPPSSDKETGPEIKRPIPPPRRNSGYNFVPPPPRTGTPSRPPVKAATPPRPSSRASLRLPPARSPFVSRRTASEKDTDKEEEKAKKPTSQMNFGF